MVRPTAAPYFVRWVRRFLSRPASDEPLTDQVRGFCEELERNGGVEDWQVRQADQALRMYFVNFLKRTEWHQRPASHVAVGRVGQARQGLAGENPDPDITKVEVEGARQADGSVKAAKVTRK